jgi:hypothetical protein
MNISEILADVEFGTEMPSSKERALSSQLPRNFLDQGLGKFTKDVSLIVQEVIVEVCASGVRRALQV